jgi:HlyD family secretion protein
MNFTSKIRNWIISHKLFFGIIVLALAYIGYKVYGNLTSTSAEPRYFLTIVEKGNISAKVSGTGQVSASNQIDLKPKVSGDIKYITVKEGQQVKAGALVMQLDSRDAEKLVRDAQVNLESASL